MEPTPPDPVSKLKGHGLFLLVFPSVMLPMFLGVVDQTIVATALPGIIADLGSVERASLVMVAYLLAATIVAPMYGALGDHFGRRRLLFAALVIALAGSICCALSPTMETLIAARTLQGLGGGGLMAMSHALIGETVPPRDRARYQGYIAAITVTASFFGPLAGGFLTEAFGWRAVFVVNLPLGIAAFALIWRLPARARLEERFHLDLPGLLLVALFVVSLISLLQAVQRFALDNPLLLAALAGTSAAALVAIIVWERRARHPIVPLALLRDASVWRCDAMAACHGGLLVSLITFLPIYARIVLGMSPSSIGLMLVPMMLGIATGSLISGRIVSRTGRTAILPSVGLIGALVMLLFLAAFAERLDPVQLSAFLCLLAIFMGSVMNIVHLTVQIAAGPARLGAASAFVQFSRSLGAALGTALVGTVLFLALARTDVEAARLLGRIVQGGPEVLSTLPFPRRAAIEAEITAAFRFGFLTMAAIAALALAFAWSVPIRRV